MKIRVDDFVPSSGVRLVITAETEAERVLLFACVADENNLREGDEDNDYDLTLPVSN